MLIINSHKFNAKCPVHAIGYFLFMIAYSIYHMLKEKTTLIKVNIASFTVIILLDFVELRLSVRSQSMNFRLSSLHLLLALSEVFLCIYFVVVLFGLCMEN